MEERKEILQKFKVIYFSIMIAMLLIFVFLITVQLSGKWAEKSKQFEVVEVPIQARRGNICAADGSPLAASIPHYRLRMDLGVPPLQKYFYHDVDSLALRLSRFFRDRSAGAYKAKLVEAFKKKDHYFLVTKSKVNYAELQIVRKFPIFRNGQFKGGLITEQEYERIYPLGNFESRTLGKLSEGMSDGKPAKVGAFGLEESFEEDLRGEEGVALNENISGRTMNVPIQDPVDGCDIVTTLDVKLQDQVSFSLKKMIDKTRADYGTAILMEVKTGDIKAISNYGRNSGGELVQGYQNYALGNAGCSEPGSTFKLASLMAAMEDGKIDTSTMVETGNGQWTYKKQKMRDSDYEKGGHGKITAKRALELSSNIGIAKLITENYAGEEKQFFKRIKEFGLYEPLKVKINGEGKSYIKQPGDPLWSGVSLAWMSFGYELKVTPLQTLAFYNAVANDGCMMRPRLVKAVMDNGEVKKSFGTQKIIGSICSGKTIRKAQSMLEGVIERGTGTALKSSIYKIAGKTGTAQVANRKEGYNHLGQKIYQSSFAGYFPADAPRYSCIVVINNPRGGNYYGGSVAGPVFKQIADYVYAYELGKNEDFDYSHKKYPADYPGFTAGRKKDIAKILKELDLMNGWSFYKSEWVEANREDDGVAIASREIKPGTIPNVKGMGLTDAVYLLEKSGLRVSTRGFGKVKSQSLRAGDNYKRGQNIVITLG